MSNLPTQKNPRLNAGQRITVRTRLLRWYDGAKRDLPWRGETNPYRIWVSEAMLQQTRAETVRGRYERFLARFPTLKALADAPLEAVLAEWQGLGYYTRARNLHRAAREIAETNSAQLPQRREALRRLPGFGPYMSAAVASIAFGERAAAMDGNGIRVLSRLIDFEAPADAPAGHTALEAEAEALVPPRRPGDFNQALMDLGARICLPRKPLCDECPWKMLCAARAAGTVHLRPAKRKKSPPRPATVFQFWAEREGALRIVRREENGLFGGMWELPGWMEEGHAESAAPEKLQIRCDELLGPDWRPGVELARLTRTLTHRKILFIVHRAIPEKKGATLHQSEKITLWAQPDDLAALPLSTAQRAAIVTVHRALRDYTGNLFA